MKQEGTVYRTDVLVIGGGMAGCMAAITASNEGVDTILVDKGYVSSAGQTPYADSFCIFDPELGDDMDEWMGTITKAGDYVNMQNWTRKVLEGSKELYHTLCSYDIPFAKDEDGNLIRLGNGLGPLVTAYIADKRLSCETLRKQVLKAGGRILDRIMITDLMQVNGRICGAVGMTVSEGDFVVIHAKAVVLATGASSLKHTGWPNSQLTSDGDMMAYRLGAAITGKEYNDTHTVSVHTPIYEGPGFLNKGIGGPPLSNYRNVLEEDFSALSIFHLGPEFEAHKGNAPITFVRQGNHRQKAINVCPPRTKVLRSKDATVTTGAAAGMSTHKAEGIWPVGLEGGTELPGLYAAGDALGIMLNGGAYSAGGMSLSGSGVMGTIAGHAVAKEVQSLNLVEGDESVISPLRTRLYAPLTRQGGFSPSWVLQLLNNLMIPYFMLYVKKADRIEAALTLLTFYRTHLIPKLRATDPHELRLALECENIATNCEMKMRASLMRQESRGTHYREDYPHRNDEEGLCWILIRNKGGEMELTREMVPDAWRPDPNRPSSENYFYEFPIFEQEGM